MLFGILFYAVTLAIDAARGEVRTGTLVARAVAVPAGSAVYGVVIYTLSARRARREAGERRTSSGR